MALKELTISSKMVSSDLTSSINAYPDKLTKFTIEVIEPQDCVKVLQFLRQLDKENNTITLVNICTQLENVYEMLW